jgi:hypothetical protein
MSTTSGTWSLKRAPHQSSKLPTLIPRMAAAQARGRKT